MCCQVSKAPPPPLYCDTTSCDLDSFFCAQGNKDEWGNPFSITKGDLDVSSLEKRGPSRPSGWKTAAGYIVMQFSLTYPTSGAYMRRLQAGLQDLSRRWWRMRSRDCDNPAVSPERLDKNEAAPLRAQVEHTVPVSFIFAFQQYPLPPSPGFESESESGIPSCEAHLPFPTTMWHSLLAENIRPS